MTLCVVKHVLFMFTFKHAGHTAYIRLTTLGTY